MKRKIGKIQYTVRFVALEALVRIERGGAYSNLLLRELMNQGRLNDKDGRLLTEMVYGTISRQLLLDYYLANFIKNAKKSIHGSDHYCVFLFTKCCTWTKYLIMLF